MTIQIMQVNVLDNPALFTSPFKFEITFDCLPPGIKDELEWKLIYVGSADNDDCDQELDSVLVGPVQVGKNRFIFEAPAPNPQKIPEKDLLDVTVLLLTCSYNKQEFIRVGYYVSNEYPGQDNDNNNNQPLPSPIDIKKIRRNILANKPRVTRFQINWEASADEIEQKQNQNNNQNNQNNQNQQNIIQNQQNNNQNNNNNNGFNGFNGFNMNNNNQNNQNNNNNNMVNEDDYEEDLNDNDDDDNQDNEYAFDDGFVVNDIQNNNQNNGNQLQQQQMQFQQHHQQQQQQQQQQNQGQQQEDDDDDDDMMMAE